MSKKTIQIAAIQMESKNFAINQNLSRAYELIETAVMQKAELVLLPELMPSGYIMTEKIWDTAEPFDGYTVPWLKKTSKYFGIWLGTSFIEADSEDFYNTFVLTNPDGEIDGVVRKNPPASVEAYFMKEGNGHRYIDTQLGRIGISICGENIFSKSIHALFDKSVDLVLQPMSAPTLMKKFPFLQKDVEAIYKLMETGPREFSRMLGVPIVMANKCGKWSSPMPGFTPHQQSQFTGQSCIIDSDGSLKACLSRNNEGVIVEQVTLDPHRKATTPPLCDGRWSMKMPWFAFLWPFTQKLGRKSYQSNQRRKARARSVSKV